MAPSDAFTAEARENLAALESGLLALESVGEDELADTIAALFRAAHNLKGMAAMEGLDDLSSAAHRVEAVLDVHRRSGTRPEGATVDALLAGSDALSSLLDAAEADDEPPDTGTSARMLTEVSERLAGGPSAPAGGGGAGGGGAGGGGAGGGAQERARGGTAPGAADAGNGAPVPAGATGRLVVTLDDGCRLPGARATVVVRRAATAAEVLATEPPTEEIRTQALRRFAVVVGEVGSGEELAAALSGLPEVASVRWDPLADDPTPASGGSGPDATPGPSKPDRGTGRPAEHAAATIRVDVTRLDELTDRVGELLVDRNRLAVEIDRTGDRGALGALRRLDRTLADISSALMRVRLVSLSPTVDRLRRLVRDVARDLGRDVSFEVEGAETEIDRSMVDEMVTPLVHLLRNAVDHGIEPPELRRAAGKPERGHIGLRAYHQGSQVVIEVADDGAGIDLERVAAKAVRLGLVTAAEVGGRSAEELLDLMFTPGFSTREEVSEVSGRGVGLDVVRSQVVRLGGQLDVSTAPGVGTTFRVRLPLSLAVLDALLVSVAGQVWAVPIDAAVETVRLDRLVGGVGAVPRSARHGGALVPLIFGREELAGGRDPLPPPHPAVLFDDLGRRFALVVDELVGSREIVVKAVPAGLRGLEHLAGATILPDGSVGLILDLPALARVWRLRHGRPSEVRVVDGATAPSLPDALRAAVPAALRRAATALASLAGAETGDVVEDEGGAGDRGGPGGGDGPRRSVAVPLTGDATGHVVLEFSGHAGVLAGQGVPGSVHDDAVAEWANVVAGQLVVGLSELTGARLGIGVPEHPDPTGDRAASPPVTRHRLVAGGVTVDATVHVGR